jgi:hypothetical protein
MYVAGFDSYAHPSSMHEKQIDFKGQHISQQQLCRGMEKIKGQRQDTNKAQKKTYK